MLHTALVVSLGAGLVSQVTYPDQIDILRGADTTPQIELVLDTSGSMDAGWGCFPSVCNYYYGTRPAPGALGGSDLERDCNGAANELSKNDQIKAALTGCTRFDDGVLDKWDQRVLFSVREFGGDTFSGGVRTGLLVNFDPTFANHAGLESAVLGLRNYGGTPLAEAYVLAGQHMNAFFRDTNTEQCRQNYIVLMTDGEGNGPSATANWITNLGGVTINDAATCFPNLCGAPYTPPFADAVAAYMFDGVGPGVTALGNTIDNSVTPNLSIPVSSGIGLDALMGVTGVQPIRTYTIGFQAPSNAQALLSAMAVEGDGNYYNATNYQQLDQAFTDIITSIVARSNVTFTAGSVQTDGIFSGNYIYSSAFKPVDAGNWLGTTRKYCIVPPTPADTSCIFYYPSGNVNNGLHTNPAAQDIWSAQIGPGVQVQDATQGGSGLRIWNDLLNVTAQTDPPPATNPLGRRTILTWRHGVVGYVPVDGTNLTTADTWTNNLCEHYSLLNKLHGYTYDVADCPGGNYAPINVEQWPEGDSINSGNVVIKYTKNCESATDRCYVATVANDGMLHFFNAYSGIETSAIIPADLWQPNSIAHNTLAEIMLQPNLESSRKFYFDGRLRLFHDDNGGVPFVAANAGNGVIDPGEPAQLIAPLGRAGAAMIEFSMMQFNGVPDDTRNPPRALYPDPTTGYQNLQDTWAAPWIGRFRYQGSDRAIAAFSSGHRREEDAPTAQIGAVLSGSGRPGGLLDSPGSPQGQTCNAASSDANWTGVSSAICDPIAAAGLTPQTCVAFNNNNACAGYVLGLFASPCCYDWSGWAAIAPPPWDFSTTGGSGHSIIYGPISWQNGGGQVGAAYRVGFDRLILQPNDYVAVLDGQQHEVGRITGNGTDLAASGTIYTPWVNDASFYLQLRTDGIDDADSFLAPFNISDFQYVRRATTGAVGSLSYPTIYLVDVNRWNGPNLDGSGGQGFSSVPTAGDARQADALLARITSRCSGTNGPNETCVDATTNANTADLQYMVCGVSSELSVYTEGDLLRSIYFMDRCGQIFKVDYNLRNLANPWSARRLLTVNNTSGGAPILGNSKDHRQGFTQLELVLSQCNGSRSIGVYFGTGNMQRPAEFDNLMNGAITSHTNMESTFPSTPPAPPGTQWANVMGVVWDSPTLPLNASLVDLVNVTTAPQVTNPRGTNGFFIELRPNEKMLRKPLVLDSVAYFKTYLPTTPATECVSATGVDTFFVFNSCNALALTDADGDGVVTAVDRVAYAAQTDIGGEILAVFPKNSDPIVSHGNLGEDVAAQLPKNPTSRGLRLFMWRKFE